MILRYGIVFAWLQALRLRAGQRESTGEAANSHVILETGRPSVLSRHQPHRRARSRAGAGLSCADPAEDRLGWVSGYRVVNAGVSGETSAGALRRVDWLFREPVSVLVVETGANDGLAGTFLPNPAGQHPGHLRPGEAAATAAPAGAAGHAMPAQLRQDLYARVSGGVPDLARRQQRCPGSVSLQGVGGIAGLNQADGIHPTAEGQRKMAETVWRVLEPVLRRKGAGRTKGGAEAEVVTLSAAKEPLKSG